MDDPSKRKSQRTVTSVLAVAGMLGAPLAAACTGDAAAAGTSSGATGIFMTGNTDGFDTRIDPFRTDAQNRAVLPDVEVSQAQKDPPTDMFGAAGGTAIHGERIEDTWRVCREERWQPRHGDGAVKQVDAVTPFAEGARRWSKDFFVGAVRLYHYDRAGRLVEVRDVVSPDVLPPDGVAWLAPKSGLLYCARYDQDGRLTWSIDTAGVGRWESSKACADLSEDNVDSLRVMYNDDGTVLALLRSRPPSLPDGGAVALMQPDGYDNAGWTGTATFLMPPRPDVAAADNTVGARIASGRGIASLYAYPPDFAADDAQPIYRERPQMDGRSKASVHYDFPEADLSMSAARDGFANLASYPRVRSYGYGKDVRVEEVFAAGSHVPVQRVWRSQLVLRQEDYDAAGKVQQVIRYGSGGPGAVGEDLAGAGRRAGFRQTLLGDGSAAYRVYRYDRKGQERLELACWLKPAGAGDGAGETQCGSPDGNVLAEGLQAIETLLDDTYGLTRRRLAYSGI
ncbi:hypothetical protein [Stenotrophomonas sp. HMWF003]|uniref:hypothetical protein n=1 Tax=Stenotrophomonas sp. HMWF003 TaxID=2056840 RepID=UPI000FE20895|nr:hypothetical protein [Stenotrophomonas sp. HMWF003]